MRVSRLLNLLPEARKNWPRFNEYFSVFDTVATMSFQIKAFVRNAHHHDTHQYTQQATTHTV
mgnify:CR=1 FL=1